MAGKKAATIVNISIIERGQFEACILGAAPIGLHRMNMKAMKQLSCPGGPKTAVEKKTTMKHNPREEFRESPYIDRDPNGPTLIHGLGVWFKNGMACVPRDMPDTGTSMTQLSRLILTPQERVPIWGIPKLRMDVVRQSGQSRAPDIRTRAFLFPWATKVTITYTKPVVHQQVAERLLVLAGFMSGVGEWRPEKGGRYGTYELVAPDDPRFLEVIETGGRAAQIAAMENPICYDKETEELFDWQEKELARRGFVIKVRNEDSGEPMEEFIPSVYANSEVPREMLRKKKSRSKPQEDLT